MIETTSQSNRAARPPTSAKKPERPHSRETSSTAMAVDSRETDAMRPIGMA
jgi:hypothetical protein